VSVLSLFWLQAAAVPAEVRSDLVDYAAIVGPYARCEFTFEPQIRAAQNAWSTEVRQQYADPTNKSAAAKADRLMNDLNALGKKVQAGCGYEATHQQLRARLLTLHPKMDSSRAFWMARSVFHTLNNLNEGIVKLRAGVFPPSPPAPPPRPSSVPQASRPDASN
jgi:hypothetical protein